DEVIADALLAFLNSSFVGWYLDQRTPAFRGGYKKFEVQHLTDIPIPRAFFDIEIQDCLTRLARDASFFHIANPPDTRSDAEAKIDEIVNSLLPETERANLRS
ncbi:MAG TPA: hypothetical protein VNN25_05145, partial [Thermoanaerobaculia bacterium]|nr:hypothetical protein [Thermoanaerobaculia bacterium]